MSVVMPGFRMERDCRVVQTKLHRLAASQVACSGSPFAGGAYTVGSSPPVVSVLYPFCLPLGPLYLFLRPSDEFSGLLSLAFLLAAFEIRNSLS